MNIDVNKVIDKMASRIALLHREMAIIRSWKRRLSQKR